MAGLVLAIPIIERCAILIEIAGTSPAVTPRVLLFLPCWRLHLSFAVPFLQHRPKISRSQDQSAWSSFMGPLYNIRAVSVAGICDSHLRKPGVVGRGYMRSVKHVLLGSAAGIFAVAGAQAADLPVKAKPVEYVKVCSLYGAGFWYVPGTDTCIKIGAYIKLQTHYHANPGGPTPMGLAANGAGDPGGRENRLDSTQFTFNNRAAFSMDLRTQTE